MATVNVSDVSLYFWKVLKMSPSTTGQSAGDLEQKLKSQKPKVCFPIPTWLLLVSMSVMYLCTFRKS